jgi:LAS superfamily LD-carboxypeptidase LdcB
MIEAEGEAAGGDFAAALARWQKSSGLAPSGVLDGETLYRMVSVWQGSRLKQKGQARADELLLAPTSDFYDSSRPEALRNVERETYAAYKRMVAAAAADPSLRLKLTASGELAPEERFLKIVSAHRSPEYQARLRAQSPNSGRAGLAVNSPHFTGRALDIYVGGEPVETKDSNRALQVQTPVYRWLVRNAERFGFRPYYYEPWHWEYVGQPAVANR